VKERQIFTRNEYEVNFSGNNTTQSEPKGGKIMEALYTAQLSIPLLQIVAFLVLTTVSLLFGRVKLSILINYCFALYLGYIGNLTILTEAGLFNLSSFTFFYVGFGVLTVMLAMIGLLAHHD
jgi:hypothetical protein